MTLSTPRLLTPIQWGAQNEWSRPKSYRLFRNLPDELKVKVGNRVYVSESALSSWLASGGQLTRKCETNGQG